MAWRPPKRIPKIGKAQILKTDDMDKKKIKQQIAKKRYEIEMLQIELEHPKKEKQEKSQIGFCTN
jgi:hypothetical protein